MFESVLNVYISFTLSYKTRIFVHVLSSTLEYTKFLLPTTTAHTKFMFVQFQQFGVNLSFKSTLNVDTFFTFTDYKANAVCDAFFMYNGTKLTYISILIKSFTQYKVGVEDIYAKHILYFNSNLILLSMSEHWKQNK